MTGSMLIAIDGSMGEGGGQVLRTALTLAVVTGRELQIENIRAGRKKPGLQPQHLKSVEAAAAICGALVEGSELDSQSLRFLPSPIRPGNYSFDIGTAGAASLVFQTILIPLARAASSSTVTITGGTHVPWSPCYHYLDLNYLPMLWKMDLNARLTLQQAGFYPRGGGRIRGTIEPGPVLKPLTLLERGRLRQVRGLSVVADLPRRIATRMRSRVIGRMGRRYPLNDIRVGELPAASPGAFVLLLAEFEHTHWCHFALGEAGKPADQVADETIDAFDAFMATPGVIDQYLADQLILPLVFASGISQFWTNKITSHLLTNIEVVRRFLPVVIEVHGALGQPGLVRIDPKS